VAENVVVLGGDGFCGWPAALKLSAQGYAVTIVDNLSRRKIDVELECESLTPIQPVSQRLARWRELGGGQLAYINLDVARDYTALTDLFTALQPRAVIHYAEQRAAPYSMKTAAHKRYTVNNNINATHNVLCSIVDSGIDIHLVHLGTMGVYGYKTPGLRIPEGYLPVQVDTDHGRTELDILYPADPGSIYHTTKTMDALLFYFYNKNDGVRITDLHQGIVWGTQTPETVLHPDLINRFDYDGDYGTVLNRFLMQAAVGHPLTVYGTGGQTRAFIHIRDSARCVELAVNNPPANGERVRILNQVTETHTLIELASLVAKMTGAEIRHYRNPRREAAENRLEVCNEQFMALGLEPTHLSEGLLEEIVDIAQAYRERCDERRILPSSAWSRDIQLDDTGVAADASGAGRQAAVG
jgi:UDP-sulfoquinovose synthase